MVPSLLRSRPGHARVRTSSFAVAELSLKGLLLCLSLAASSATDDLIVSCPKATLTMQVGDSLYLNCTITYHQQTCGTLTAHWCKPLSSENCTGLTDSNQYLITTSEKDGGSRGTRSRQNNLKIEILSLSDEGYFQCRAHCRGNGQSAMGNIIHLSIHKAVHRRKPLNSCGRHRAEIISVVLHFLLLMLTVSCAL